MLHDLEPFRIKMGKKGNMRKRVNNNRARISTS